MKPLDPKQFRIWHRLRRMPRLVFIIVFGSGITAGAIVGLNVLVSLVITPMTIRGRSLLIIYIALALVMGGAFAWTWSYMQKRYQATRGLLCTTCGYTITGLHSPLCPECGKPWGVVMQEQGE